jgi:hypothetical protein
MIKLTSLRLQRRETYHENPGALYGKVEFKDGDDNEIVINLKDGLAQKILELCAEAVVDATTRATKSLTEQTITQLPMIGNAKDS